MGRDSDIPQWRSKTIFFQSASGCVQAEMVLLCRPWLEVGRNVWAIQQAEKTVGGEILTFPLKCFAFTPHSGLQLCTVLLGPLPVFPESVNITPKR